MPATFTVELLTPGRGRDGESGATFTGDVGLNPIFDADGDGIAEVEAANRLSAAKAVLTGGLTMHYKQNVIDYPLVPGDIGSSKAAARAAGQPYFGRVKGDKVTIGLEDLVRYPNRTPDWDFNDCYVDLVVKPTITVTVQQSATVVGLGGTVHFQASALGGTGNYAYTWDFGDGTTGSGESPSHTYQEKGDYKPKVTVADDRGAKGDGAGKPVKAKAILPLGIGKTNPNKGYKYEGVWGNYAYGVRWVLGPETGARTEEAKGVVLQRVTATVDVRKGNPDLFRLNVAGNDVDVNNIDYWEAWGVSNKGLSIDPYVSKAEVHAMLKKSARGFGGFPPRSDDMKPVNDLFGYFGDPKALEGSDVTMTTKGKAFFVSDTTIHQLAAKFPFVQKNASTGAGKLWSMPANLGDNDPTMTSFTAWLEEQRTKGLVSNTVNRVFTAEWSPESSGKVTATVAFPA